MRRRGSRRLALGLVLLALGTLGARSLAAETTPQRWLHVKVEETGEEAETVRINLPLSVAEKVLPTLHAHQIEGGKVKVSELRFKEVDLRALLEAIRSAPDNEFVTVESPRETVRVAKQGGYLLVKVEERDEEGQMHEQVDVKVPFTVVDALLSGGEDELDLVAGVRALSAHGDTALVTVNEPDSKVRIWVDSRSTME